QGILRRRRPAGPPPRGTAHEDRHRPGRSATAARTLSLRRLRRASALVVRSRNAPAASAQRRRLRRSAGRRAAARRCPRRGADAVVDAAYGRAALLPVRRLTESAPDAKIDRRRSRFRRRRQTPGDLPAAATDATPGDDDPPRRRIARRTRRRGKGLTLAIRE